MVFYANLTMQKKRSELVALFASRGAPPDRMFLDESIAPKDPNGLFQQIKDHLRETGDGLCIDTISSLGKNNREIAKELRFFRTYGIPLVILDIPSSAESLVSPVALLSELYTTLAQVEIDNVKKGQKEGIAQAKETRRPLGRKKIPYPNDWEQLYAQWERREISAGEFMDKTGLKKGTFYNLIKQYRVQMAATDECEINDA